MIIPIILVLLMGLVGAWSSHWWEIALAAAGVAVLSLILGLATGRPVAAAVMVALASFLFAGSFGVFGWLIGRARRARSAKRATTSNTFFGRKR